MNDEEKEVKKSEVAPASSEPGRLVSFDDFDRFFDDFLSRRWPRAFDWNLPAFGGFNALEKGFPKVDIIDQPNEIEVRAALPGVKKEDLDVTISNQSITIRASTREEKKEEGKYFRREISRGEYQRTVSLPEYVDEDNAKATFSDGILKITLPKTDKGKRKNIEVQ